MVSTYVVCVKPGSPPQPVVLPGETRRCDQCTGGKAPGPTISRDGADIATEKPCAVCRGTGLWATILTDGRDKRQSPRRAGVEVELEASGVAEFQRLYPSGPVRLARLDDHSYRPAKADPATTWADLEGVEPGGTEARHFRVQLDPAQQHGGPVPVPDRTRVVWVAEGPRVTVTQTPAQFAAMVARYGPLLAWQRSETPPPTHPPRVLAQQAHRDAIRAAAAAKHERIQHDIQGRRG